MQEINLPFEKTFLVPSRYLNDSDLDMIRAKALELNVQWIITEKMVYDNDSNIKITGDFENIAKLTAHIGWIAGKLDSGY